MTPTKDDALAAAIYALDRACQFKTNETQEKLMKDAIAGLKALTQPPVDVEGVMKPVVIESPFAGDTEGNRAYLYECCLDCLRRNESPYASHGFFVHFLDDLNPAERKLGIDAGLAWSDKADIVAVYTDRGISNGMKYAIDRHKKNGKTIEYRSLK